MFDRLLGDNAKEMLTTWQMHTPNNSEPPGLNFRCAATNNSRIPFETWRRCKGCCRAMNKLAIVKGGGVSTKDVHEFRQNHCIRIAFAEPLCKVGDV